MKNICIPENLFYDLVLYHLCDMDSLSDQIKKELNDKMEAICGANTTPNTKLRLMKSS